MKRFLAFALVAGCAIAADHPRPHSSSFVPSGRTRLSTPARHSEHRHYRRRGSEIIIVEEEPQPFWMFGWFVGLFAPRNDGDTGAGHSWMWDQHQEPGANVVKYSVSYPVNEVMEPR